MHITGVTEQNSTKLGGLDPISKDPSVNSDVREYTIHVGAEADLGRRVTVPRRTALTRPLTPVTTSPSR